jgi:hypothetical protein
MLFSSKIGLDLKLAIFHGHNIQWHNKTHVFGPIFSATFYVMRKKSFNKLYNFFFLVWINVFKQTKHTNTYRYLQTTHTHCLSITHTHTHSHTHKHPHTHTTTQNTHIYTYTLLLTKYSFITYGILIIWHF